MNFAGVVAIPTPTSLPSFLCATDPLSIVFKMMLYLNSNPAFQYDAYICQIFKLYNSINTHTYYHIYGHVLFDQLCSSNVRI